MPMRRSASAWSSARTIARRAGAIPEYHALRTRDFTYIEYATGERELYDLRRDPYQLRNIYPTADQSLVSVLSAGLSAVKRCRETACRTVEDTPMSVNR